MMHGQKNITLHKSTFPFLKTNHFKLKQFTTIKRHFSITFLFRSWHITLCILLSLLQETSQLLRHKWRHYFTYWSVRRLRYPNYFHLGEGFFEKVTQSKKCCQTKCYC